MLFSLNTEIAELKTGIMLSNSEYTVEDNTELKEKLHKRWLMVAGEGTVFLVLLAIGIYKTHRTFKKEIALSEQQKNFLLSITHELKSPLASNKLQVQTLLKHDLPRERQLKLLTAALHETDRLINLTDNLLMAAKIESRDFSMAKEESDISGLIREAFFPVVSNEKENLKLDLQEGIKMKIDKTAFPSIVLNLYENARKYSAEGAPVTISLKSVQGRVILSCTDEGFGIPDTEKNKVFKKFYRIGSEETRKTKGTGLGLFIVKNLVEKHEGRISIKNNKPKGSVFEIYFNTNLKEANA